MTDFIEDDQPLVSERLSNEEMIQILKKGIPDFTEQLNQKEVHVLEDRLLSESPKTLQEIADTYGLTRERVRQIEAKIILKLKDYFEDKLN